MRLSYICMLMTCLTLFVTENAHATKGVRSDEQSSNDSLFSPSLQIDDDLLSVALQPHITLGSHIQAAGIQGWMLIDFPQILVLENISIFLQSAYQYSLNNIGIPGEQHLGFFSGALVLSFGKEGSARNEFIPLGRKRHNWIYQYHYYIDSVQTNQISAIVAYYYSPFDWTLGFAFENDVFALLAEDEFRTAAMEIQFFSRVSEFNWGIGLGAKIWGGTTDGYRFRGRGTTIDISPSYGGSYSHGILYGAFYISSLKFSVGWDSEHLRSLLQNSVHYIINIASIAPVPNIPDRFFIQVELNPRFSFY